MNKNDDIELLRIFITILVIVFIVLMIPILVFFLTLFDGSQLELFASIGKNLTQIFFFISTIVIAFFTYVNAKRTLFNPLRSEVFKKQLELLENFDSSIGKILSENDLYESYKFEEIFLYNWMKQFVLNRANDDFVSLTLMDYRITMKIVESDSESAIHRNLGRYYFSELNSRRNSLIDYTTNYIEIQNSILRLITSNIIPTQIQYKLKLLHTSAEIKIEEIDLFIKNDLVNMGNQENNIAGSRNAFERFAPNKSDLYRTYSECLSEIKEYLGTDKILPR